MFARDYKIEVAADNKDCVFWKMIRKGEHVSPTDEDKEMAVAMLRKVLTMTFNSYEHPTIRLWLRGGQTCVETGGWLILDTEHRWWGMDNEYHRRLAAMGKIRIIK